MSYERGISNEWVKEKHITLMNGKFVSMNSLQDKNPKYVLKFHASSNGSVN